MAEINLPDLFLEAQNIINTYHKDESDFFPTCNFELGFFQETDDAFGFCNGTFPNYKIGIHKHLSEPTNENMRFITMTFVHELLHIIHADWKENQVANEEYRLANLAGCFDTLLRRDQAYLSNLRSLRKAIDRSNLQQGIPERRTPTESIKIPSSVVSEEPEFDTTPGLVWASYMDKRFDDALRLADQRLEKHDDGRIMYYKGRIFYDLEKFEEALSWIDRALTKIPNDPYPVFYKGLILMQLGRLEDAEYYFTDSFTKNTEPDETNDVLFRDITYYRAKIASKLDKIDTALAFISQLTAFYPESKNNITSDADFEKYRDNPRFQEMMKSENS